MKPINIIESKAVAVPTENIDTDQIIPARFLKTTSREGFGEKLFYDWTHNADGSSKPSVLDGQNGSILVAGNNFGCGSSREHAAWALSDAGYDVVVSSSFADIFKNNALNNGMVPVQVPEAYLASVFSRLKENPGTVIKVNLAEKTIDVPGVGVSAFDINAYKQECLMKGYSDIDYLIEHKSDIINYEKWKRQ